jgi:D-aminopeptidase
VIATDAPVDRQTCKDWRRDRCRDWPGRSIRLERECDYAIAFSTAESVRLRANNNRAPQATQLLANDAMSPLFLAVIEATEEAIYNSLFRATTISGRGHTVEALPIDRTLEILRKYNAIKR